MSVFADAAQQFGAVIDGLITLAGGIFATLLGYRIIWKKKGENLSYDLWHERRCGLLFKIGGPFLIAFCLYMVVTGWIRTE